MTQAQFTHKGWLGICPIYLSNPAQGEWHVTARHWTLEPILTVMEWMQQSINWTLSHSDPTYEPGFLIRVTGVR